MPLANLESTAVPTESCSTVITQMFMGGSECLPQYFVLIMNHSESGSTDRNTLGYLITGSVGVLEFAGVRSCGERLYNLLAAEVSSRKCNSEDSPFISVRHGWGSELG